MLLAEEKRINTQELTEFEKLVKKVAELPQEEQEKITYMAYGFMAGINKSR